MNFYKYLLAFTLLIFSQINSKAQNLRFAKRALIGTSITYFSDYQEDQFFIARYDEWTWDKHIAVNLNKSFYFGLSFKNIYSRGSSYIEGSTYSENSFVGGAFLQYDVLPKNRNRVYLQTAWQYGNYCTCGSDDPYEKDGLHYIGLGLGTTIFLNDWLAFESAINLHAIMNEQPFELSYNIVQLGLVVDLKSQKD